MLTLVAGSRRRLAEDHQLPHTVVVEIA